MKRAVVYATLIASLSFLIGIFGAAQSVSAVNNFTITDYRIEYILGRDEGGRSVLKTTETIVADFTRPHENRGIERAIPNTYSGHPTSLQVSRVTSGAGSALPYTTYTSAGNTVVRIGDKDAYVLGRQTYVIEYTQRDVTRFYRDTAKDEFYWDTNGTEWRVPIERLSVTLRLADGLGQHFAGDATCYKGRYGSAERCVLSEQNGVFSAVDTNLKPGGNVTLAIGFTQGTFMEYQHSPWDRIVQWYIISLGIGAFVAALVMVWLAMLWVRLSSRSRELGTIIPEYIPPRDTSVTTSAVLVNSSAAFSAQLIDFAVRHYIKLYQTKVKKYFWSGAEYDIEIVRSIESLLPEEQEILSDVFSGKTGIGSRLALKDLKRDTGLYTRMQDNDGKLRKLIRGGYGIRHKVPEQTARFKKAGYILLGIAVATLNPFILATAIAAFVAGYTLWPLTDKGLALKRYLEGLKLYIGVAEEERLKLLQSPEGAERVGQTVDPSDTTQLVKLYERVLPYAVLFGQEKEWNRRLGVLYETSGAHPDWYSGSGPAFSAAIFSSLMSDFASAATYASPSSSSSGGSSGGGFSGGGGGGGGGGGW